MKRLRPRPLGLREADPAHAPHPEVLRQQPRRGPREVTAAPEELLRGRRFASPPQDEGKGGTKGFGRAVCIVGVSLALAACDDQSMRVQNRYEVYGKAPLFPNDAETLTPPDGTVAQGALAREAALTDAPPVDAALMERGRQRYEAICTPCHGYTGHGDGMVVQRGFPPPPSYHEDRLRAAPAAYFVDVITKGYGVMYPYAARVEPRDRWAIAAYIRALQLSQGARVADVPGLREELAEKLP